jgi:uncharacterized protein
VAAAIADPRLKAVAAVSMVNIGDLIRHGWYGEQHHAVECTATPPPGYAEKVTSDASSEGLETESTTPGVSTPISEDLPVGCRQAHDYYLRLHCEQNEAEDDAVRSHIRQVLTFDAFAFAELYLKHPLFLLAGREA